MSVLEPPYGERDPRGMTARLEGIPDQIAQAVERLRARPWPAPEREPARLVVGGMGGSAIAADLTRGLYEDSLPRPLEVTRGYRWPGWVGPGALALLSSYSGDTEETLALYRDAGCRGAARLALTTGGALGALCARDGVFVQSLPPGSPPRAALYASWVALTGLVHALGWCAAPGPDWGEAEALLRARSGQLLGPDVPEEANPAKRLARALHGRLVLLYAGAGAMEPVALRWKQQLHENAKLLAHSAVAPELNHNEIVGWERPGEPHRSVALVVLHDHDDPGEVRARLELTADYARRQGAAVHEWGTPPGPRLARLAAAAQFGDWLSLYLALLGGADPTAIPSIDEFKRRLSSRGRTTA